MKKASPKNKDSKAQKRLKPPQEEAVANEEEKDILLDLSDAIIKVREKSDLIKVFSSTLKDLFYFTHAVISLINKADKTYYPFLLDVEALHIRHRAELPSLLAQQYFLDDPFIAMTASSETPVSFRIADIMANPGIPGFVAVNYETGIKEAMIAKLKNKMETIGYIFIYSDREGSFPASFKEVLQKISPLLSSAVANIVANEEILKKDKDKTFLLEFSREIASARTKKDLSLAIHAGLKKLSEVGAYFIRTINEDGVTMSPFMHDEDVFYLNNPLFQHLLETKIPVNEGITGRVMNGTAPVVIDFGEEIREGHTGPYIEFWKKLGERKEGFRRMIGTPLSVGDKKLAILWVITPRINSTLLEGLCAQISVAIANIQSNEEIMKREQEKSFLLDFSNDIAAVRTKDDLETAIAKVFRKVLHEKLTMIRLIEEDGVHLKPYIYDQSASYLQEDLFKKLFTADLTIREELTERVLLSDSPVVFNIEEEERQGNKGPYIHLWKSAGFKNAYGAPLRVGNTDLGTLWLLTDEVNTGLLKGICAQISIAISNIKANEQVLALKQMLEVENDHLKEEIRTIYKAHDIVGNGEEMQRVFGMISLVAPSNSTVLILGETGTGKELAARAIHQASPRADKLMIKVNCAALPANLIESELFGHERGAFTGAVERRIGKFELANNSTLFLDEVGEMPLETQVKLLRVIQERELERVGGKTTIKVNVRIIAATNRNLEEEVKEGRFRPDLYYRLNVFPILLPPLRHRLEDIEALTGFFLSRYSKTTGKKVTAVSAGVMKELKAYSWPGNVRELEHLIERSVLLSREKTLHEIQLPKDHHKKMDSAFDFTNQSLEEVERAYIIETLKRCQGKIAGPGGAAEILAVPSTTLHSKLLKLKITKADYFSR